MKKELQFQLDSRKVTGKTPKKYKCPQCGKKSFVRYVDTRNGCQYVNNDVGKCDRINHCGYHYTPHQFFDDNPWLKEVKRQTPAPKLFKQPKRKNEIFQPLSYDYVLKNHSPLSTFWQWMISDCKKKLHLTDNSLNTVYDDYMIGCTNQSDIIFWQIDEEGRVHTGHIMQYGPDGHRLSYQNWQHSILIKEGELSENWQLNQCFFGQHLLKKYSEKIVYLVESEKTAVILAALQPDYVWLAASGSSGLSEEKLTCLKNRQVKVIPDSGCYEKWSKILLETKGIDFVITNKIETYEPNTDLADIFLGEAKILYQ